MSTHKAHVAPYKKKVVADIKKLILEYPIVGAINMENLPAKQLQTMKKKLKGKIVLFMTKRRLIKIAIEETKAKKPGIEALIPYLKGMPALLFTNDNPFALYKVLKQNKSKAPAKAGQTAPSDILVPAAKTNFLPGPIIGELGAFGIKTKVEAGKLSIVEDKIVAKAGTVINAKLASVLQRLEVMPMEIGLDLCATVENGVVFTKEVLDIDEKQFVDNITKCALWAFNLAIDAGVLTKETTSFMLTKAQREARVVAIEAGVLTKDTLTDILGKASMTASALKTELKLS